MADTGPGRDVARGVTTVGVPSTGYVAVSGVPRGYRRISWGAVFAGFVVAVSVQLLLSVLGFAIGLTTIEPTSEARPVEGLGMGAVIWWLASGLVALGLGGAVAGRLAGVPRTLDSALHGLVTWCVLTIVSFLMISTAAGQLLSAAAGVVGRSVDLMGRGVGAVSSGVSGQDTTDRIWAEARGLLRDTGDPALQPETLVGHAERLGETAEEGARRAATQPGRADEELDRVLNRFFARLRETGAVVDKQDIVNVLTRRADMSPSEAQQTVDRWEREYREARGELREMGGEARQVAERAAHTLGAGAFWGFVAMLVGAVAGAVGGGLGTPRDVPVAPVSRD